MKNGILQRYYFRGEEVFLSGDVSEYYSRTRSWIHSLIRANEDLMVIKCDYFFLSDVESKEFLGENPLISRRYKGNAKLIKLIITKSGLEKVNQYVHKKTHKNQEEKIIKQEKNSIRQEKYMMFIEDEKHQNKIQFSTNKMEELNNAINFFINNEYNEYSILIKKGCE